MYEKQENIFYYLSVGNENYAMPAMPDGVKDGILKGMYRFQSSDMKTPKLRAHLFGSGAIMNQVIEAQKILEEKYKVASDIWSITSYNELRREALDVERTNVLNPLEKPKISYITQNLVKEKGVFVAASDNMKALPDSIGKWFPRPLLSLGTDGFGRSDSRPALRDFFEVDARHIVYATLVCLYRDKEIGEDVLKKAAKDLKINPKKLNPMIS